MTRMIEVADMRSRIDAMRRGPSWSEAAHVALCFAKENGLATPHSSIRETLVALIESGKSLDDHAAIQDAVLRRHAPNMDMAALGRARRSAERLSDKTLQITPFPTPPVSGGLFAWRAAVTVRYGGDRPWGTVIRPVLIALNLSQRSITRFDEVATLDDDLLALEALQEGLSPLFETAAALRTTISDWLDDTIGTLVSEGEMPPAQACHTVRQALPTSDLAKHRSATPATLQDIAQILDRTRAALLSGFLMPRITRRIRSVAGYDDYVARFTKARQLNRRHLLIVGPTNSGKTHRALELAAQAPRATILSPLRLLALEHYEALSARFDVEAGMLTGEEAILPAGVTHIAQTIETLDVNREVDVAVIDEVQMLADRDRGWAWTQALVGVAARTVISTGSVDIVPIVSRIAALCGEEVEIINLDRKTPLRVIDDPVPLDEIGRGDAVICFSRREVFTWRELLTRQGLSVASVYGALSPEVRGAEAERFRTGRADVLVATDAIGMGLNLGALRRVLFTALSKYDGHSDRPLTQAEILQIAGRAGRYGYQIEGLAGVTAGLSSKRLRAAVSTPLRPISMPSLFVQPDRETLLTAHREIGTDSLSDVLVHLERHLVEHNGSFRMSDLKELRRKAQILDATPLPPLEKAQYVHTPIDTSTLAAKLLRSWAQSHAEGESPIMPASFGTGLIDLELAAKLHTAFLWLSRRWPDIYEQSKVVREARRHLDRQIGGLLTRTASTRAGRAEQIMRAAE